MEKEEEEEKEAEEEEKKRGGRGKRVRRMVKFSHDYVSQIKC